MNAGYLSLVVQICVLILLASGWKSGLAGAVSTRGAYLFILGLLLLGNMRLGPEEAQIGASALILITAALFLMYRGTRQQERFLFWSSTAMTASFYFFLRQLLDLNPIVLQYGGLMHIPLLLGMASSLFAKEPRRQLAGISLAMVMGEAGYLLLNAANVPFVLGDSAFLDRWWLTAIAARSISLVTAGAGRGARLAYGYLADNWLARKKQ